jgi:hypothetical protein
MYLSSFLVWLYVSEPSILERGVSVNRLLR